MHQQMQEAEDYLAELAEYYLAASLDLQDKAKDILRRFRLKHNLTQYEAEMLLANIDPSDIKKILERLEKDPKNKDLRDELTAQAAAARIRNLESLFEQVKKTTSSLAEKIKTGASKLLKKLGLDSWHKAVFNLQKQVGAGWKVKSPSEKLVEKAVEQSWAGSGFSKRIWGNTEELEKAVKKEIMKSLLTGRPIEEAAKAINDQFGKGMYNARRLVRTEAAYITNQMALRGYRDQGVEKYVYVAILDLRTSKICRSLDKKRFLVKNAKVGVNFPPMHPFCRSTTIPWVSDALLRRMKQRAYDPRTGKYVTVPGDMTYEQWYKQFVEGQPKKEKPTQERNLTLDQYNRYKARFGDAFPYTYEEFVKMKSDKDTWEAWQRRYKTAGETTGTARSSPIRAVQMTTDDVSKDLPFNDVTEQWKDNQQINEADVSDSDHYTVPGGDTYYVGQKGVKLDYDKNGEEIKSAPNLSKATGQPVKMCPRVLDPEGVKCPDYLLGHTEQRWDRKGLHGKGPNALKKRILGKDGRGAEQAENFYVDISDWKGTEEDIIDQAHRVFDKTEENDLGFVEHLTLVNGDEIIIALERNKR